MHGRQLAVCSRGHRPSLAEGRLMVSHPTWCKKGARCLSLTHWPSWGCLSGGGRRPRGTTCATGRGRRGVTMGPTGSVLIRWKATHKSG